MKVCALILVLSAVALIEAAPPTLHCPCISLYDPVCSPAGKTYSNACNAKCHGVDTSTLESGECASIQPIRDVSRRSGYLEIPDCVCIGLHDPVCGDGNTYTNACQAVCDDVDQIEAGECVSIQPIIGVETAHNKRACAHGCDKKYEPVCNNGQITYSNYCVAHCHGKYKLEVGEC